MIGSNSSLYFSMTSYGGLCPVQAEGIINGKSWYFRARHEKWQFFVKDQVEGCDIDGDSIVMEGVYGEYKSEDAGYMPIYIALRCIADGIEAWIAKHG